MTLSRQEKIIFDKITAFYVEDVHVFFAYKNIIFDKITAILTLTFQTLVSSIHCMC